MAGPAPAAGILARATVAAASASTSLSAAAAVGRTTVSTAASTTTTTLASSTTTTTTRTLTTSATALLKQEAAPAAAVAREAAHNPASNARLRVTDGLPPTLYVPEGTPITSEDPSKMPAAATSSIPASQSTHASTKSGPAHPAAADMARGAESELGGADATKPGERTVNSWGANARSADFNPEEGRRNPVLDGGSNEGGLDAHGNSKT